MNTKLFIVFAFIALTTSKIGDKFPFCMYPEKFETTVQPVR